MSKEHMRCVLSTAVVTGLPRMKLEDCPAKQEERRGCYFRSTYKMYSKRTTRCVCVLTPTKNWWKVKPEEREEVVGRHFSIKWPYYSVAMDVERIKEAIELVKDGKEDEGQKILERVDDLTLLEKVSLKSRVTIEW